MLMHELSHTIVVGFLFLNMSLVILACALLLREHGLRGAVRLLEVRAHSAAPASHAEK